MIKFFAIIVIVIFIFYAVKFVGRIFLRNLARKMTTPPENSTSNRAPKPKSNLDKSKAIDAQFEELK